MKNNQKFSSAASVCVYILGLHPQSPQSFGVITFGAGLTNHTALPLQSMNAATT